MQKNFLIAGSVAAALAVILGAFGAHALKSKLSPEQLQVFETGVRYQFYHSFALIIVFLLSDKINASTISYAGGFFIAGIVMFSGSVYLLSCRDILGIDSWKSVLGPITPLGGLCFIAGWIFLIIGAIKFNNLFK